jgi:hypothetical protein
MRSTRLVITGLAAVAALAVSPGWAAAASPLVDDSVADFSAGTGAATWAVEPGSVQRRPSLSENFDGTALPSGLSSTEWSPGGASTVSGGAVSVDGALAATSGAPALSAPQVLEFRAAFGGDNFEHAGFGTDFNDNGPWAMFSTGNDGDATTMFAYARTSNADPAPNTDPITVTDPTATHTYRIEWGTADIKYFVDGELKATIAKAIAGPMRPAASDALVAGATIKIEWLGLGDLPASGTFTSRVLDAGDPHAVWGALTATGGAPVIRTRTGNTATPDASWSSFDALGAGGAVQSPPGRYIQYEATLDNAAPRLDSVSIANVLDDAAPDVAIGGVQVNGTTATVSFGSSATDVTRFECNLDGGTFATCTSPKQFSGLAAGAHSVAVRAVDHVGNIGNAAGSSFAIEGPPAPGGGAPAPAPAPAPAADKTAPKVTLKLLSARVSKSGAASLRVGCPSSETRCTIGVALKLGRGTVAKKTITVTGGKTAKLTLRLSKAARRKLARSGRLNLKAVITATDAANNTSTATVLVKLRAPSA